MLRFAFSGLLVGLLTTTGLAQTTPPRKPAPASPRPMTAPAAPATQTTPKMGTDGQGEYVAPATSGAPDEKVTTDYSNRPLKQPATGTSTMSSRPRSTPAPTPKKGN